MSLNAIEEAPAIRENFPDIAVETVDQSAAAALGKPLVMLDSVWEYARRSGHETFCLLNSDLLLRDASAFHNLAARASGASALIFGSRLDVTSPAATSGEIYDGGFDYFLIPAAMLEMIPSPSPFCLGAPWWDFWLPMVLLDKGQKAWRCTQPIFAHVKHETQWDLNWHAVMGLHVAQYLLEHWRAHPPTGIDMIFAEFFFRRMRVLSDAMSGQQKTSPEMSTVLQDELTRSFLHSILKYVTTRATPLP